MSLETDQVNLKLASSSDLPCIENLMQFYNYDFSEWYPIEFGAAGLYVLRPKMAYWANPNVKPFLIRVGADLAGFAVVDGEGIYETTDFNLGYFFVARRFRRKGVGRKAAEALIRRFVGRWEINHVSENSAAAAFWRQIIAAPVCEDIRESTEIIDGDPSRLFRFSSAPAANATLSVPEL
jgi:predicted acetyltransferase